MRRKRKTYTPEEKVAILRRHLLEKVEVSDLCDEYEIHPTMFFRWQKALFEGGTAAFEPKRSSKLKRMEQKVVALENRLNQKNNVMAELMEEYIHCKKKPGEY